jgi:hypothetical protein
MKTKLGLLTILLFTSLTGFSQWTYKTITNGFDDPFKKAFTATNNNGWLAMETGESKTEIEYPDSIVKKMLAITDILSIKDKIASIPYIKSDIIAYQTKTSYINKLSDSSKNINGDFLISIGAYKDPNYYSLSYDLMKKQPTYKIVTTSGTYYIGDTEYYSSGFPRSYEVTYMGSGWSEQNTGLIIELKNYMKNYAIEKVVKYPLLYLHGAYFCDDVVDCDFVFTVGGVDKKYVVEGMKSSDNKILFFDEDLFSDKDFKSDFLAASKVKIRANESYCDTEYYTFIMSSSTAAYNFINK